jgi:hypothetical protein
MSNHDQHYKQALPNLPIEAIDVMESMICTNIPEEHHEQLLRNFCMAMAFKYESRLGLKDIVAKEFDKINNWHHRAQHGEFRKE